MKLEIEYIPISEIKLHPGNAKKHPRGQIEQIKKSMSEYGFNDPIALWHGEIVEGHGRYLAARELHIDPVPVFRLDHLTDDQRIAYGLVHNQLTLNSKFDPELLAVEIERIPDLDIDAFGFTLPDLDGFDDGYYGDERERTNNTYNLGLVDREGMTDDFWQMPIIKCDNYVPKELIGFNYAKTNSKKDVGVHFYIDDYQFERVWNSPEKYVDVLLNYECILSPDFSLYLDMPTPMKIWNIYRSRQIGAYYQSQGIKVIPTISWAEAESFEYCFRGIPKGSIVSVSTIGVKKDKNALQIWREGMDEMMKQIEPSKILLYGGALDYDYKGVPVHEYKNNVIDRWKENSKGDSNGR